MIRYAVLLMFALVLLFFALTIELPEVVACIQEKNPATRVVVASARKEGHIVKREFLGCAFFYHTGSVY